MERDLRPVRQALAPEPRRVLALGLQQARRVQQVGMRPLRDLSAGFVASVLSKSSLANDLTMPKAAPLPRGHAANFGITLLACRLEGPLPLLVLT